MIIKWLVDALSTALAAILDGLGALVPTPPGWVSDGFGQLAQVYDKAGTLDSWVPFGLALTVAGTLIGLQLIAVGMRVVRVGISYATLGGGAVAE